MQLRCGPQLAQLDVQDEGVGMDAEHVSHIFERFWQADPKGYRKQQGLGLGLSIAQYLVQQHDGTLTARSDGLGRGSTFTLTLPLIAQPSGACCSAVSPVA